MNLYNLFYKQYFADVLFEHQDDDKTPRFAATVDNRDEKNNSILNCRLNRAHQDDIANLVNNSVELKVAYPGLITGIGITHEVGITGEFKLGMHLDYTTGMPIIYGSSLKGVLRSYIQEYYCDGVITLNNESIPLSGNRDITDLIMEIFSGLKRVDDGDRETCVKQRTYEAISIYERDIFFDAVIVAPSQRTNRIVDSDNLCPHGTNPLISPNPISFLKIAPGVTLRFRFKLNDGIISASNKLRLFKQIFCDWGIGAKTNVGYGQLSAR